MRVRMLAAAIGLAALVLAGMPAVGVRVLGAPPVACALQAAPEPDETVSGTPAATETPDATAAQTQEPGSGSGLPAPAPRRPAEIYFIAAGALIAAALISFIVILLVRKPKPKV